MFGLKSLVTRRGAVAATALAAVPAAALAHGEGGHPPAGMRMMTEEDAATLERFRVQEGLCRYVDALNHRDWAAFKDCWVEDCTFTQVYGNADQPGEPKVSTLKVPQNIKVVGREAMMALVATYNNSPWLTQQPHGFVVELEGPGVAKTRQTLVVMSQSLTLVGISYDRLVKGADGRWRFKQRDFRPAYFESVEAKGLATRPLPDPNYRNRP